MDAVTPQPDVGHLDPAGPNSTEQLAAEATPLTPAAGRRRLSGAKLWRRRAAWTLRGILVAICVSAGCLTILPAALGLQRYVITGISMTGTIDKGSIAYDKVVPTSSLKVGDIITYKPPAGHVAPGERVTHRIVSIAKGPDGQLVYQTKGDYNKVVDPWKFYLDGAKQAVVTYHIPYVGYGFAALAIRWVRMGIIGGIATLLAIRVCISLWIEAGIEERARRKAAAEAASGADPAEPTASELDDPHLSALIPEPGTLEGPDLEAAKAAALAALVAASAAAGSRVGDALDVDVDDEQSARRQAAS